MLQVNGLTRRYGSFIAVNNVSFSIEKGEIVGLLGHNGAGKTTIMKMLSGYLEPDDGHVQIDGIDLSVSPKTIQKTLGYLPENLPVYPEMIVAEYLDYAARLKGLEGEQRRTEIKRVVSATEIREKLLEPIYTLSRGFKQRVGVAQAILGRPKLLILDEPTNGLDPTQTEHMRELIRDISKEATVILSTHIMQEVDAICDRVLILNRGEMAVDARLEELRHSNRLSLQCSLDKVRLEEVLRDVPGLNLDDLDQYQNQDEIYRYILSAGDSGYSIKIAAQVAQQVVANGGELYQLTNEKRDLESLFKEVSQGVAGGLSHAA